MATVHNEAKKGDIAKVVLMCGDPLRAKFIADNYLSEVTKVNQVRNMFCYTGDYRGKKISVMGSGMGVPSMGIYVHELYEHYDVDTVIRVGTCGSFSKDVKVRDVIIAMGACSDSNYASEFELNGTFAPLATFSLLDIANTVSRSMKLDYHVGNILTSDVFYHEPNYSYKKWSNLGVLGVEMETYALYLKAAKFNKKALTILTVSDNLETKEETTSEERQSSFNKMMELALEVAYLDD